MVRADAGVGSVVDGTRPEAESEARRSFQPPLLWLVSLRRCEQLFSPPRWRVSFCSSPGQDGIEVQVLRRLPRIHGADRKPEIRPNDLHCPLLGHSRQVVGNLVFASFG